MRILIPILGFGRAGGNRVLSQLANAWRSEGHAVSFLSPDTGTQPYFPTTAEVIWVAPDGRQVPTPREEGMTGKGNFLSLLRGVRREHQRFEIVLANHSLTSWPIWLAGVPRQKRFYYVQAYEPDYYKATGQRLNYLAAAFSYRLPFTKIVNATTYPGLASLPFVPFGVDLALFHPSEKRATDRKLVIGTIGRREAGKGTRFVLEAFRQVCDVLPDTQLRVAYGNLPEDTSLLGVEVVYPGDDSGLARFYRELDVLVTGTYGQTGAPHYPVLEAMACGVPVVHAGYLPGTERNSWISRPQDSASIAAQILRIVKEPQEAERRCQAALEAVKPFAWEKVACEMLRLFT
jgi:glycosyltransferase involved in cell wall biosynthesis